MKKDNNPQTRYTPKPSDWNGHNYIPFYDKVNKRAFQYKKDSPEYYEAIKDGLEMMNKEEWYRYMEKDRARRNGTTYNPDAPIPKEWQNPKTFDMSKEASVKREREAKKAIEDEKFERSLIESIGNVAGLTSSYTHDPITTGIATASDVIGHYNNYRDARNSSDNYDYNYYDYLKDNKGQAFRDYANIGLDLFMGSKKSVPRFNFAKAGMSDIKKAKLHNGIVNTITNIGRANDVDNELQNQGVYSYKYGGKLKEFNPFNINTRL